MMRASPWNSRRRLCADNVQGLIGEISIAATLLGDDTLALCAEDCLSASVTFSVPPQSLGEALRQLAKQADLQVLFAPSLVDGHTSPAVSGTLSAREALQRMLSGTSLTAEEQSPGVVVVRERLRESRRSDTYPAPTHARVCDAHR